MEKSIAQSTADEPNVVTRFAEVVVRDLKGVAQSPQRLPGTQAPLFTLVPQETNSEPEIVVHSLPAD